MDESRDPRKSQWVKLSEYSALALTLAFCVLLGLFGGRWIGRKLGNEEVGTLVGLLIGIAAAGVELYRAVREIDRFYGVLRRTGKGRDQADQKTDKLDS
ncbi:MAG: hypothetical protein KatS3mg115_0232 [Candidatus Poribacteria bacterium]|nr:MAG: hypothetical protein KatS3mg115_0232 [Candidatus Poribacteria bacterium]